MLLLVKFDLILEKKGCKRDALVVHSIGHFKTIFALSTKQVVFYIQVFIVQIAVFSLEKFVLEYGVFLAIFMALNK